MDKKDVVKAILNVKKYTKNLKKNAKTLSQINIDESQPSSPYLYSASISQFNLSKKKQSEQSLPFFNNASSSFREKHDNKKRKTIERSSTTKLKRNMHSTIQPALDRTQQSIKIYESQHIRRTTLKESFKSSEHFNQQQQIEPKKQQKKQTIVINNQLIKQLQLQIAYLEKELLLYKSTLVTIKHKYIEMQIKLSEKVSLDHFVDVLKLQLEKQRDKNCKLCRIINEQRDIINSFNSKIATFGRQLDQYYGIQLGKGWQLEQQNRVLREMLKIYQDTHSIQIMDKIALLSKDIKQIQTMNENEQKHLKQQKMQRICRSLSDIEDKWKDSPQI